MLSHQFKSGIPTWIGLVSEENVSCLGSDESRLPSCSTMFYLVTVTPRVKAGKRSQDYIVHAGKWFQSEIYENVKQRRGIP